MKVDKDSTCSTTQEAPLERLLSRFRSSRVGAAAVGQRVLDFGCGKHGWNALRIAGKSQLVDGVDASLSAKKTINNHHILCLWRVIRENKYEK